MNGWVNFNGSFVEGSAPLLTADSRAFRYGDGLFETMRVSKDNIHLKEMHFERLFGGIGLLQIALNSLWTPVFFEKEILKTIHKNRIAADSRVRFSVFRGEGGLYETDGKPGFIIQAWPLEIKKKVSENGLVVGLYKEVAKNCDVLSNIKSNNYLAYVMAALHAKKNHWNDCIILNNHGRICDASIANVFWVKDEKIYTPPLSEGCVAGVMRRNLLEKLPFQGFKVEEVETTVNILEGADEIFLTNATSGVRWVKEFNGRIFKNNISAEVFHQTF